MNRMGCGYQVCVVRHSKIGPWMGQIRSFGDVGSMSGLPESGHGWTKQSRVYFLSRLSLGKIAEL
jgi:hypothetical protein